MSRQERPSRKASSSRPTVTSRLALSWTRWRQSRRERRLAKRRAELELLLTPLLFRALTPAADAMKRLDQRQVQTQRLLEEVAIRQVNLHSETKELLLEILNSLQPPPSQEISRLVGLPTPPTSHPSSAS